MSEDNPLAGPAFDALYDDKIAPGLHRVEHDRRRAVLLMQVIGLALIVVVAGETWLNIALTHGHELWPEPNLLILTLIGGLLLMLKPITVVARQAKAGLMDALCAPLGLTYEAVPKEPPVFAQLVGLHLLPNAGTKRYEDMITGRRGDCAVMICEASLTAGSARDRGAIFLGQVFSLRFPRRFEGRTVVMRAGWLSGLDAPPGLRAVGLEDPEFERTWAVFGDDQVLARTILTPAFMQQLAALESAYAGKHLRCAFLDGDLVIALEGEDRFEIGGMFSPIDTKARVERMAGDIGAVFRLIDAIGTPAP